MRIFENIIPLTIAFSMIAFCVMAFLPLLKSFLKDKKMLEEEKHKNS